MSSLVHHRAASPLGHHAKSVERGAAAVAARLEAAAAALQTAADDDASPLLALLRQCAETLEALVSVHRCLE